MKAGKTSVRKILIYILLLIFLFFYNEESVPDNNICVTNSWKQAFTVSHKSSNGTRERKASLFLPRDIKKQPMWGHVSSDEIC